MDRLTESAIVDRDRVTFEFRGDFRELGATG